MRQTLILAMVFAISLASVMTNILAKEVTTIHPLQPSDTSSPRATFQSFIDACNELYDLTEDEITAEDFSSKILPAAERIRDCLDLSGLPAELRDSVGIESAVYLKEVIDRIELPTDN